jgi:hypothetical protein
MCGEALARFQPSGSLRLSSIVLAGIVDMLSPAIGSFDYQQN